MVPHSLTSPSTAAESPTVVAPGLLAYVGSRTSRHRDGKGHGIEVFSVPADAGRWQKLQTVHLNNPTYLALSPTGNVLYSAHGDGSTISILRIDATEGTLSPVGETDSGGTNPVHLAVTVDRRHLLVANHNSGTVAALPIRDDETLGDPVSVLELVGELGPHRRDQNGAKPHQIVLDPGGQFVLVPDKGMDSIFVLEVDPDGTLHMDPGRTVRLREMSGPRHLVLHPDGRHAFSVEEFRSTVTAYDWDPLRGRLAARQVVSSLPDYMTGDSRAAEIALHPSATTLYVSNRGGAGDHSTGGFWPDTIAVFSIESDGHLAEPRWANTAGTRPRFFCTDPTASRLLVAHERSHTIAEHTIDPHTGNLSSGTVVADTGSPVVIICRAQPSS